jgi:hypothetical protein
VLAVADWVGAVGGIGGGVAAILAALTFYWQFLRKPDEPEPAETSSVESDSLAPAKAELTIRKDGSFVGGDDEAALQAVVNLLEQPVAAERRVEVHAPGLDDGVYRQRFREQRAETQARIKCYERCLNELVRGAVYYHWKFKDVQLAQAFVELRHLALPGLDVERCSWFVWPPSDPAEVVQVRMPVDDVEFFIDDFYKEDLDPDHPPRGLPDYEPVCRLAEFGSWVVWTRVVPAVLYAKLPAQSEVKTNQIDISDWLFSDKPPEEVAQKLPPPGEGTLSLQRWEW